MLRTKLCDLLDIEYPIVSACMALNASGAPLAIAVSEAGGMGTIGGTGRTAENFHEQIKLFKKASSKPFAVGLRFKTQKEANAPGWNEPLPDPPPPAFIQMRRELKEMGIDVDAPRKPMGPMSSFYREPDIEEKARISIEERVPAIQFALGMPEWVVKEAHAKGIKLIAQVSSVKNARRAEERGADIVIAQGHEAGGHPGPLTLLTLLPQVVDAVNVPVLAAGGITDGRHLAAALAMGASGVWVGTRFIATYESTAHTALKERILKADETSTAYTKAYDGYGTRLLKNRWLDILLEHEGESLPYPMQRRLNIEILAAGTEAEIPEYMEFLAGQGSAMIKDLKSAREVVQEMVSTATELLGKRLPSYVK